MLEVLSPSPPCGGLLTKFSAKPCTILGGLSKLAVQSERSMYPPLRADPLRGPHYSGLASDGYGPAFPGASLSEEQRGAALAPYRNLDADRLKLSGRANWDPSPYLHDALYLAFREPDSLLRPVIPIGLLGLRRHCGMQGLQGHQADDEAYLPCIL